MKIDCPVCREKNCAKSITNTVNIPYFGDVIETLIVCEKCGFKHSDVISIGQDKPKKECLKITKKTLSSRVVRSQSSTISIPEIGIKVEPGPKSEGYVSNVEGVITRFISGVKKALKLFNDEESQKNSKIALEKLEKLLTGEFEATLIIDDPYGQSKIADTNVQSRPLSEDELKDLRTGFTVLE